MFTYHTKDFAFMDSESIELWLNSFSKKGLATKIVGYVGIPMEFEDGTMTTGSLSISVLAWPKDMPMKNSAILPARTTIDEIPEEPTIQYPDGEIPEAKDSL